MKTPSNHSELTTTATNLMKEIITSVYQGEVQFITDPQGFPPCEENNFLMNIEGTAFAGVFFDQDGQRFPFLLKEKDDGRWTIRY